MFGKLAFTILAVGLMACVLLATRQQRLQAVHELAQVQKRVAEHDRDLWRLRLEIARRITPQRIERMATILGPLQPLRPAPGVFGPMRDVAVGYERLRWAVPGRTGQPGRASEAPR
ncbi:MAG: hypothetical protein H7Y88_07590 [Phycisphaerales bacterium]|nr:hypothetical protein [Phycisphaerales bacterium]